MPARSEESQAEPWLDVLDLADGRAAPEGVRLVLRFADGAAHTVATSPQGRVSWGDALGEVVGAQAASPEQGVVFDDAFVSARRTLWWWRRTTVTGTVVLEHADAAERVPEATVFTSFTGTGTAGPSPSEAPWEPNWLRRHGVTAPAATRSRRDGSYSVSVPRVRGVSLSAAAPGYRPEDFRVPVEDQEQAFTHDFTLKRSYRVSGVVSDEQGRALSGVLVSVYVTMESAMDAVDNERLRAQYPEGGVSAAFLGRTRTALLTVRDTVRTDESGGFDLPVRAVGPAFVFVAAGTRAPAVVELGTVDSDRSDLSIVALEPAHGIDRVTLQVGGVPVREHAVVVSDVTRPGAQPALEMATDADGALPAYVLVPGQSYAFSVFKPLSDAPDAVTSFFGRIGFLRWRGETVLDMDEMGRHRGELQ
jgi:hypothetical protein